MSADDWVGGCSVTIAEITAKGNSSNWYNLNYKGKPAGQLMIQFEFHSTAPKEPKNNMQPGMMPMQPGMMQPGMMPMQQPGMMPMQQPMQQPMGGYPMQQPMGHMPMQQPMMQPGMMPMQQPMGGHPMQQPMGGYMGGPMPMQQPGMMPMQPGMGQPPMGGMPPGPPIQHNNPYGGPRYY